MKLADLSPARRAWLRDCLYDSLIEKHEGPWGWGGYLLDSADHAEFLVLGGHEVLLPIPADHNPYITALHSVADADGQFVTLWLKDMYLGSRYPSYSEKDAWGWAGRLAVCQRAPGTDWFVAVFYHEMYLRGGDPGQAEPIMLPRWTGVE
ncbi:MAG: hypothetical protein LC769_03905 [Chloroflexi bacterium]|nr:hypothetical protein [Chloroflexota bacterium]